jgi:hypothetical protein
MFIHFPTGKSIYLSDTKTYRASQKDVPDFNNLLLEFNTTQANRIGIDRKENSPIAF